MNRKNLGMVLVFLVFFAMFLIPLIVVFTPNLPSEFDKLYEKSRNGILIREINLDPNDAFTLDFAVKERDMIFLQYKCYNFQAVLWFEMTLDSFTWKWHAGNFYCRKYMETFINYTGIITGEITNIDFKNTYIDLFIIVYDQYFPPIYFPPYII